MGLPITTKSNIVQQLFNPPITQINAHSMILYKIDIDVHLLNRHKGKGIQKLHFHIICPLFRIINNHGAGKVIKRGGFNNG